MPRTNPSQHLTLARVDQIANLVLKGEPYLTKKEKPLWPSPKEAWQLGLSRWEECVNYIGGRDDLSLNSAQRSRRASKLSAKLDRLRAQHRVDNDFVWTVKAGWHLWGFVCAPSEAAAKQIGHTMFVLGDTERLKISTAALTVDKIALGGWDVAARRNLEAAAGVQAGIKEMKKRIDDLQLRIVEESMKHESLMSAAMSGGVIGGEDETSQAG